VLYEIVSERRSPSYKVSCPEDVYKALSRYARARTERFLCATLSGSHDLIAVRIITVGLVNRTIVHPREVYLTAIKDNAVAIIVAHNHPSGHLEPSPEDIEITNRLRSAGEILGISMLDHLVISKNGFLSFVQRGFLSPYPRD